MTLSKLGTGLEPTGPQKTTELKFTDYSINKYKPDFKGRKKFNIPFIDSGTKGLKLKCVKSRRLLNHVAYKSIDNNNNNIYIKIHNVR